MSEVMRACALSTHLCATFWTRWATSRRGDLINRFGAGVRAYELKNLPVAVKTFRMAIQMQMQPAIIREPVPKEVCAYRADAPLPRIGEFEIGLRDASCTSDKQMTSSGTRSCRLHRSRISPLPCTESKADCKDARRR